MKKCLLIFIVLYSTHVSAQQTGPDSSIRSDTVFIRGQIKIKSDPPASVVKFFVNDYVLGCQHTYFSTVDAEGRFEIKFFLRNTEDIGWRFNQNGFYRLLLSPGDSLSIQVDNNGFKFSGDNAKACQDIHNMRSEDQMMQHYRDREKGFSLEPEDYLKFRKEILAKEVQFLESYCKQKDCSPLFLKWFEKNNEVTFFNDLLSYSWKSLNYGLYSAVRLTGDRKRKYDSSYWASIKLEDPEYTLSSGFFLMLNGYSHRYTYESTAQSEAQKLKLNWLMEFLGRKVNLEADDVTGKEINLIKEMQAKVDKGDPVDTALLRVYWKIAERYDTELKTRQMKWWIERHTSGLVSIENTHAADLLLSQFFYDQQGTSEEIDHLFNTIHPKIVNKQYRDIVQGEYEKTKLQRNVVTADLKDVSFIPRNFDKTGDQLLSQIVKVNPNKLIVLDFWSTWCSPCRTDFMTMKSIKTKLPSDSVCYIYLCCQSTQEDWIRVIQKMDVKGQHYFITQLQYADLQKKLKIPGFPSYYVIDTNRKIHRNIHLRDEKLFIERLNEIMRND